MKLNKKTFFQIISFLLVLSVFLVPVFLIPQINKNTQRTNPKEVFLELWNVDTFEGGKASRGAFLEKQAVNFQKTNTNVYIIVKNLSTEQAELQLASGAVPDFVSYGIGAGKMFKTLCKDVKNFDVREDLKIPKVVPWCLGGYVLCSIKNIDLKDENAILNNTIGFGVKNTICLSALNENVEEVGKLEKVYEKSKTAGYGEYNAYEDFLKQEFDVLLGTQRDFFRLLNRINLGALDSCKFNFLSGYSDLVQWFSVLTDDEEKTKIIENFIDFILSEDIQRKLVNIGMFSSTGLLIYEDENYKKFEEAISKDLITISPFLDEFEIREKQNEMLNKIFRN